MRLGPVRERLLGCMIGLARTCSTNPPTEETSGLLMAGLMAMEGSMMTDDQLRRLTDRVIADKAKVSPNCATCQSRCGKNDDYDLKRLYEAPEDVRDMKLRILRGVCAMAKASVVDQLTFDCLFALAEDWDAETLRWYAEETEKHI